MRGVEQGGGISIEVSYNWRGFGRRQELGYLLTKVILATYYEG